MGLGWVEHFRGLKRQPAKQNTGLPGILALVETFPSEYVVLEGVIIV